MDAIFPTMLLTYSSMHMYVYMYIYTNTSNLTVTLRGPFTIYSQ